MARNKAIPEGLWARAEEVVTRIADGNPGGKLYVRGNHRDFGKDISGDPTTWCREIIDRIESQFGVKLSIRNGRDGGTPMRITDKRLQYLQETGRTDIFSKAPADQMAHVILDVSFRRISLRALAAVRTNKPFSLRANDQWNIGTEQADGNVVPLHGEIMTLDENGRRTSVRQQLEKLFAKEGLQVLFGQATHQRFASPEATTQSQMA